MEEVEMQIKDIKTMDELETCQKIIRRQIGDEGNAIASSFRNMREEYSPRNIMARSLGAVSEVFPFRQLMLNLVTYLIKVIKRY
jgi:hypothetical protein